MNQSLWFIEWSEDRDVKGDNEVISYKVLTSDIIHTLYPYINPSSQNP